MRIGLVSTVSAPVRAEAGGSVEAWTWLLARELSALGHAVTTFGCAGSEAAGKVVVTLPGPYGAPNCFDDWQLCEWVNLGRAMDAAADCDVLHCQAYLWGMPLQRLTTTPMVHTLHIVPDDNSALLWRSYPGSWVTALSHHQWKAWPDLKPAAVIPHGVDLDQFSLQEQASDYLLYLGRFTSGKGPLQAIQIARALGLKLILAGPENAYFRDKVKPLVDGERVIYAGFVRGGERRALLGRARALLYPIQFPEAFGLVLAEAMLCGTPIAAVGLGAVPEIVEEGVTGFITARAESLVEAVPKCFGLDRKRIRAEAERRFSAARMAQDYVRVYETVAGRPKPI
jgi:glycosyltransferase involved in cell wall biosynthesis